MTTPVPVPTRTVDGTELPATGTWRIDPGHAEVGFVGRHMIFTKVRGRFVDVDATVTIADRIEDSTVEATIQMASVDSGNATRDDHLVSGDLFDVAAHPTATFRSTRVVPRGSTATVVGDLTIRGVTRSVELAVDYLGAVVDPWGNQRVVFDATGRIDREDWGLTWNMALDTGGLLVSREIDLVVHAELVREP